MGGSIFLLIVYIFIIKEEGGAGFQMVCWGVTELRSLAVSVINADDDGAKDEWKLHDALQITRLLHSPNSSFPPSGLLAF